MSDPVNFNGLAFRTLPPRTAGDGLRVPVRATRSGDVYTYPILGSKLYAAAQEGSYYAATNPTLGTAIAGKAAPTTLVDTSALIVIRNDVGNDRQLMLDYLLLMVSTPGTAGTDWQFCMKGDKGNSRLTGTPGGTAITPVNVNMGSVNTPGLDSGVLRFGDLALVAVTSSARVLHQGIVRTVSKVAGDKYLFKFGDPSPDSTSGIPLEGTTQAAIAIPCPPIVLDPGDSWIFHEVATGQTAAASYQFTMGFVAR